MGSCMKILILFVAYISISTVWGDDSDDFLARAAAGIENCIAYFNSSEEDVRAFRERNTVTCSQKCLVYCMYHGLGLMNGTELASYDLFLDTHKKFQVNNPEVLQYAERNVQICLARVEEVKSTNDACVMAAEYDNCIQALIEAD